MTDRDDVMVLRHGRIELALHHLRDGVGTPLLLLHGLGERSPVTVPDTLAGWSGPVAALDFTGHGDSTVPRGGGYTAENLMADADIALGHLGRATVVGRGLGAYVALLLAGARPTEVRGAVLGDGPGLTGGGTEPGSPLLVRNPGTDPAASPPLPDPWALFELSRDVRPPDYATSFARLATQRSPLEWPLTVTAVAAPDWLIAVAAEPGVRRATLAEAVALYGGPDPDPPGADRR